MPPWLCCLISRENVHARGEISELCSSGVTDRQGGCAPAGCLTPRMTCVQYEEEVKGRGVAGEHLALQQREANASFEHELACKDVAYTHRWRYAGLPVKPSHLRLDPEKVEHAGLLDPKTIMHAHADERTAELLRPPPVHEFNDATAAPHYLAQTAAAQSREAAYSSVLKRTGALRSERDRGWRSLPAEEVRELLQKSKARAKLASCTMNGAKLAQAIAQSKSEELRPFLTAPSRCRRAVGRREQGDPEHEAQAGLPAQPAFRLYGVGPTEARRHRSAPQQATVRSEAARRGTQSGGREAELRV